MPSTLPSSIDYLIRFVVVSSLAVALLVPADSIHGEEPYQRFLDRLRDQRLYDLALVYLEDLEARSELAPQLARDLELERAVLLYRSAGSLPPASPRRGEKLDAAEEALRTFLQQRPRHPRRGEARMRLGELLLTRAEEAKLQAEVEGPPAEDVQAAIQYFDEAHQFFEATVQELASELETMRGARIDPSDTAKVARREKLQQDIRQAQLLSAKAVEERGRARAAGSPQRQEDLQQALEMFADLYRKERKMVGIRSYALFYRSGIQADLEMLDDAIDGYQRIADQEPIDVLIDLQTDAVAKLLPLLVDQGKFPVAVDRGEQWLKNLPPNIRDSDSALQLRVAIAKAKLAWAEAQRSDDGDDRLAKRIKRNARDDLKQLVRISGPHVATARELLASLGIEQQRAEETEVPEVQDFSDALTAARTRARDAENESLGIAVLQEQKNASDTAPADKERLQAEIDATRESIARKQQQSVALLREAIRLFESDDDRAQLLEVQAMLAYLLLQQEKAWDAIAVGQFVARMNPGTPDGLRGAAIALGGYSQLLRDADEEAMQRLIEQLRPFAEYLVNTWPSSSEASSAASALVQLALSNQQWEQANRFLGMLPESSEAASKLRLDTGLAFYAKYLESKKVNGADSPKTNDLLVEASQLLEAGVNSLTAKSVTDRQIEAINALVRLFLVQGEVKKAAAFLRTKPFSPLQVLEQQPEVIDDKVALDTHRTNLLVIMSQLAQGQLQAAAAVEQIAAVIEQLQQAAGDSESGKRMLAGTFVTIAKDLKSKLEGTTVPEQRRRLAEGLVLVASKAGQSDAFGTRFWAADTLVSIGEELADASASKQLATRAFSEARTILESILLAQQQSPDYIQPSEVATQVQRLLAMAARGAGDYKTAMNQFAAILRENPNLLDIQMEAARTYQLWGEAVNSGFHKAAILGGRQDPKSRKNLVWGWGKLSQLLTGKEQFSEQFFESRLQLAYSRWKYGSGLNDPTKKEKQVKQAQKDIQQTASLYPDLGGAAMRRRFDSLLKRIQSSLGQPATGLE